MTVIKYTRQLCQLEDEAICNHILTVGVCTGLYGVDVFMIYERLSNLCYYHEDPSLFK